MEESVGNQVGQQNTTYLCRYEVKSVGKKTFLFCLFVFLTKCPSAALRAELQMPVGWLRLEGAHDSNMIAFCLFCCLVQIDHSRGTALKDPHLKIAFFGTQSKKRTTHMMKCTDFFMFMQVFRFLWLIFFVLHAKRSYMFMESFLDF